MAHITIKQFAEKHGVTRQAIEAAIKSGKLKSTVKFGVTVISENAKYEPNKNMGPKND